MTVSFKIRTIQSEDRGIVNDLAVKYWHETRIGYIDELIESSILPGFVALINDVIVAALTWRIHQNALQIVTLVSECEGIGIGSALIEAAENEAHRKKITRVLISTENSNTWALRFYQKRGYVIDKIHPNAIVQLRKLKPSIPEVDENGIPLRDQIDLIKEIQ